jgi:hypothetical protein
MYFCIPLAWTPCIIQTIGVLFFLNTCVVYLFLFCTITNKYTIISQIITLLLHVSTLLCHPQTACIQYLAKLHKYFKCSCWQYNLQLKCFTPCIIQTIGVLFFKYLYRASFIILHNNQQIHNYFTNYHTPTCFGTIMSSSDSFYSIPCQVTQVFQMQLLAI